MKKYSNLFVAILACVTITISVPLVFSIPSDHAKGPPVHIDEPEAMIYVISQDMYYHTIVPYAGVLFHMLDIMEVHSKF